MAKFATAPARGKFVVIKQRLATMRKSARCVRKLIRVGKRKMTDRRMMSPASEAAAADFSVIPQRVNRL
ncbi:hypothetical protein KRR38_18520 [Novosphingobium sp. G106]|uniref:hypothetical protein n=1 Tax=Novosphingobium sp. G106 TaxID=2849500 RepID=UPI001C2D768A|nr:hypothetical protein [Novosphingobium sp. G106]MBV1689622.1 hypothetical protein [Novosphingobium sp. G106]